MPILILVIQASVITHSKKMKILEEENSSLNMESVLQFNLLKLSQSHAGDKNLKLGSVQNSCVLSLLCVCASVCMCFRVNVFSELANWHLM